MKKIVSLFALFVATIQSASAETYESIAKPWQLGFQPPASPVMEKLYSIHNDFLMSIITAITLFVLAMLVYICLRFNRRANPVPSKTAHNTRIEIIWTVLPVLILVIIAIPSLRIHYYMQQVVDPQMTLKVVGYQWYWHYEYPDQGGFGYDSYMKKKEDLKEGDHRLLAVDNRLVVPVDTKIRVLLTGADVIHAFAVPAFGVKKDAMPGRLNETWFEATKIGTFFGQCSELCGVGHGFMPIVIDVVSKDDFAKWVKEKQKEAGVTADNPESAAQKEEKPLSEPVSSEHKNPAPVIEKEKAGSKSKATNERPSSDHKANSKSKEQ